MNVNTMEMKPSLNINKDFDVVGGFADRNWKVTAKTEAGQAFLVSKFGPAVMSFSMPKSELGKFKAAIGDFS